MQQKSPFRVSRVCDFRAGIFRLRIARAPSMTTDVDSTTEEARVILVVEDEVLVRMLACEFLNDGGFHSLEAVSAQEALALIDARPDIALMFTDVDMPGEINGSGLAHLVSMRKPAMKIIVTSGANMLAASDLPNGARFLQKPYSPSDLLEIIEELLAPTT